MVRHSADIVTWCPKGHDGRTAYQRARSRDFKTRLLTVGEVCRFKNRSHEPASSGQVWHEGVFVGIDQRTGQYMIFSENSVRSRGLLSGSPRSRSSARRHWLKYGLRHGHCMRRRSPRLCSRKRRKPIERSSRPRRAWRDRSSLRHQTSTTMVRPEDVRSATTS